MAGGRKIEIDFLWNVKGVTTVAGSELDFSTGQAHMQGANVVCDGN
jgi:hypothetical protein